MQVNVIVVVDSSQLFPFNKDQGQDDKEIYHKF